MFDLDIKAKFYAMLDTIIRKSNYNIIASALKKEKYIKLYGRLSDDVYEISLSFIIERAIFYLDGLKEENCSLNIVIEKRGKKEDKKLEEHFQRLMARGTGYISPERLAKYNLSIIFKNKKENVNGLQLADLIAYPIARYVLEPERINPAFDVFKERFYSNGGKRYGLKIFP